MSERYYTSPRSIIAGDLILTWGGKPLARGLRIAAYCCADKETLNSNIDRTEMKACKHILVGSSYIGI